MYGLKTFKSLAILINIPCELEKENSISCYFEKGKSMKAQDIQVLGGKQVSIGK